MQIIDLRRSLQVMKSNKVKTLIAVIGMFLLLFFLQTGAALLGVKAASRLNYDQIDPYHLFAWLMVHHIVQMAAGIVIIFFISKFFKLDWYFTMGDKKSGLWSVVVFSIVLIVYTLISYPVGNWLNMIKPYTYPLNFRNITGYLGFELLLSGPSEEILFRALPIILLTAVMKNSVSFKLFKWDISIANLLAALLFSVAHVQWSLSPFTLRADYYQLVYVFVLGIAYGVVYVKSKSILYPMMMHSFSNVIFIGIGYLMVLIK